MEVEQVVISEDDAAVYDRQIRLWGLEAQNRLRNSKIACCNFSATQAEICKNIVLAGIGSLTLLGDSIVQERDLGANFLIKIPSEHKSPVYTNEAVLERLKTLNDRVKINIDVSSVESKDENYFKNFTLILLSKSSLSTQIHVNKICRKYNIPFIYADTFGFFLRMHL